MSGRSAARQRLADAQAVLVAAHQTVTDAEAAVEACRSLAADASATRDRLAEQARAASAASAAAIRDAVKAGKDAPAPSTGKARAALAQAEAEVASRRDALQLLEMELADAVQAEAAARRSVGAAAESVLLDEAEAALAEGERAVEALNVARRKLLGLNALATNWRTARLPAGRTMALLNPIEPVASLSMQTRPILDQWRALNDALLTDADAAAPGGEPPPPARLVLSPAGVPVAAGSPLDPTAAREGAAGQAAA
jgi:hypothetical protein